MECCEVIRPRNVKPAAGSGGEGVELKDTVKRDRMGKKKYIIRERWKVKKRKWMKNRK